MIKNEFRKKKFPDLWINLAEATNVVRVLPVDLRVYDQLNFGLRFDITLYLAILCFDSGFLDYRNFA